MKRLCTFVHVLGLVAAASITLTGCGDNDTDYTCGSGTVLEGDMCVATPTTNTNCGTGTVLVGDECVPDGSVICEQGTVFDAGSGQCVVDESACADGTVLVGEQCVPYDDTLTADLEEATEPNDGAAAGGFAIPALNAMTTIHGCISPRDGAADVDVWIMTATGPTVVEITADGVGGLAAGFIVQDNVIPSLPTYFRAGINLTGDTSKRQVFLPVAGEYLLVMDDSRAILADEVAGGPRTCYFTTIKQVALPAATPLTVPTQTGGDVGNVRVLSYTADAAGDILRTVQTSGSESLSPAFVIMRGNALVASLGPTAATQTAAAISPQWTEGGLAAGDVLSIIVDNQYNFSPNPAPYTFSSLDLSAQALPTDGSTITVLGRRAGTDGTTDLSKLSYLYFDVVGTGTIVGWNFTSSIPLDMFIVRKNLLTNTTFQVYSIIDNPGGTGRATPFTGEFTRFLAPGRYYLVVQNPLATATVGESIMITSTLTTVTPTPVVYGTPLPAQTLPALGSGFHTIDFTNPTWVEFAATATDWGTGTVRVQAFDPAGEGWLGGNYLPTFGGTQLITGAAPFGRILVGETRDFILRVNATAPVGVGASYTLAVRDRPHTAVTIVAGTPIVRTAEPLAGSSSGSSSQAVTRYLVTGPSFGTLSALVTPAPTSDVVISRRGADEAVLTSADVGGDGDPETLTAPFGLAPTNFVAFTVGDFNPAASTFDLTLSTTAPVYNVTPDVLPFFDACPAGSVITLGGGATPSDEGQSVALNLPTGWTNFTMLGDSFTQFYVNSNGFMGFLGTLPACAGANCSYSNTALPAAATPNAIIAPYWDDLEDIVVCRRDDIAAQTMTLQWTGFVFATSTQVRFQARLHRTGAIDLIYGSTQQGTGSGATIGIENLAGTVGLQLPTVGASRSFTLTPP